MAKINLLPWREEQRVQRNKEFGIVAGVAAGLGVLIIVGLTLYYNNLIDNQKSRNKFMQNEIAKLDKKIKEIKDIKAKKERLLQRIKTIQELQTNRTEIVHLFDETVKAVPDGVYLKTMVQSGTNLTMSGIAESNTRVSEFIRNIETSQWMREPRINIISRNKKSALQTNDFTVRMKQDSPNRKKNEEDEG
jgi:type IV pilus assembly protein PilN